MKEKELIFILDKKQVVDQKQNDLLNTSIENFAKEEISDTIRSRFLNICNGCEIKNVGELAQYDEEMLKSFRGLGDKLRNEIISGLKKYGISRPGIVSIESRVEIMKTKILQSKELSLMVESLVRKELLKNKII